MAKAEVWLSAFAVLLTTVCWVLADHSATPVTGVLFVHELERKRFQNVLVSFQSDIIPEGNNFLTFATNLKGRPDRPGWLRYTQRTAHDNGMLYGTPTLSDVGTTVIEVTAYNRDMFETMRKRLIFIIKPPIELHHLKPLYEAEFFVKNRNVEEVLPLREREDFRTTVANIWETDRLVIINITSALDVGGRVPLPIEGRKEGVYVKVGSDVPFPDCLMEVADKPCDEELDPTSCEDWFSQFVVDWCKIVLFDKSKPEQPDPDVAPGDGVLDGGEYEPPSSSLGRRDFYSDYVVTIAVPLAIAVFLFLLLAYIMYFRREGLEMRDSKTSDIQLVHHHSIQGNTNELRQMAKGRDVPPPLSTLPMFNARTGERVPPLSSLNYDSSQVPLIQAQQ